MILHETPAAELFHVAEEGMTHSIHLISGGMLLAVGAGTAVWISMHAVGIAVDGWAAVVRWWRRTEP